MQRATFLLTLIATLSLANFSLPTLLAQEETDSEAFSIPEDEKPFWASAQKFLDAYVARNAEAIGQLFTEDAEFLDEDGVRTFGRDQIVARFREVFDVAPESIIESIDIEDVRHLSDSVALENGVVVSSSAPNAIRSTSKYAAIHVRGQDGVWRIDVLKDFPRREAGRQEQLNQLAWMLGKWINQDSGSVVRSDCQWSDDGNYLLRRFHLKTEDGLELNGVQRTGWDPIHKKLRSWTFDSQGGFLTGFWTKTDDGWLLTNHGVSAEGETVSATAIYQIIDAEMIQWRYRNLIVGNNVIADTEPVTMVRQPPEPASTEATVSTP